MTTYVPIPRGMWFDAPLDTNLPPVQCPTVIEGEGQCMRRNFGHAVHDAGGKGWVAASADPDERRGQVKLLAAHLHERAAHTGSVDFAEACHVEAHQRLNPTPKKEN